MYKKITDFSLRLFSKTVESDKNTLIAPVGVVNILAMLANGAKSGTKTQIETALGAKLEQLNKFIKDFFADGGKTLKNAGGIWVNAAAKLRPEKDFTGAMKKYYSAEIKECAFDEKAVADINGFTKKHTDGMIDKIIDEINPLDVMIMLNAVCFNARWDKRHKDDDIVPGVFTDIDGRKTETDMMCSEENIFIKTEDATGFAKLYKGGKYEFVALLPGENINAVDFAKSLTGEKFENALKTAQRTPVKVQIPEFATDYERNNLKNTLISMGISDIFDSQKSDLTAIGENLFVGKIKQKAYIKTDRKGTKAARATMAQIRVMSLMCTEFVALDRPFVYAVCKSENHTPLFIGTVIKI